MTDPRMDEIIAELLRIGMASAAALVLAGGITYVALAHRCGNAGGLEFEVVEF